MYGPPGELMNVGTPGPTLGELAPELYWYCTPEPLSISMCGLSALRLGWLSTCWRAGAVVVVVDPPATVVVVVVDEPARSSWSWSASCADATEVGSENRTEHTATAATAAATTRPRHAATGHGRDALHRDRQEFMSAPECDGTCSRTVTERDRITSETSLDGRSERRRTGIRSTVRDACADEEVGRGQQVVLHGALALEELVSPQHLQGGLHPVRARSGSAPRRRPSAGRGGATRCRETAAARSLRRSASRSANSWYQRCVSRVRIAQDGFGHRDRLDLRPAVTRRVAHGACPACTPRAGGGSSP